LYAGLTLLARLSTPPPRTTPEISRPREMQSIIASSSARRSGFSTIGSGAPSIRICTFRVIFASTAPVIVMDACMQNGAVWCSLIMMPSKPFSSTT
jgi:hypothetical protein